MSDHHGPGMQLLQSLPDPARLEGSLRFSPAIFNTSAAAAAAVRPAGFKVCSQALCSPSSSVHCAAGHHGFSSTAEEGVPRARQTGVSGG